MGRISQRAWDRYGSIIDKFHNDAFQDEIIWVQNQDAPPRFGEDRKLVTKQITLKGLYQYNSFRVWPLTQFTESGEEDKQSEVILLNLTYLRSLNLLDTYGKLPYDQARDRFFHKGIEYESGGDTFVSQAKDSPLLFLIILKKVNGSG